MPDASISPAGLYPRRCPQAPKSTPPGTEGGNKDPATLQNLQQGNPVLLQNRPKAPVSRPAKCAGEPGTGIRIMIRWPLHHLSLRFDGQTIHKAGKVVHAFEVFPGSPATVPVATIPPIDATKRSIIELYVEIAVEQTDCGGGAFPTLVTPSVHGSMMAVVASEAARVWRVRIGSSTGAFQRLVTGVGPEEEAVVLASPPEKEGLGSESA
ncbi:hypothetical protein BJ508DRAFT_344627 [Ascobolus immersus RN42]|uniref:Uncharacterized protein n=1 Tax=Ascobolus immersus RN42 TaxID=1160509 RepID=A0A3N4HA18_ASCIM|nr:hypothetical protein BJ508DRAFT_344627 [Ascobolus immersus RN42]